MRERLCFLILVRCYALLLFHIDADFNGYLPVMHLPLVDVTTRFYHLKPTQILDGFMCELNGIFNGMLYGSGRGTGDLDEFIDVVFHIRFFWDLRICGLWMPAYLQQQTEDSLIAVSTASRVSPVHF